MEEQLILKYTAKLAKKKGFNYALNLLKDI